MLTPTPVDDLVARLRRLVSLHDKAMQANADRLEAQAAEIARLREALEPFAGYQIKAIGVNRTGYWIRVANEPTLQDFDRAGAALARLSQPGGEK